MNAKNARLIENSVFTVMFGAAYGLFFSLTPLAVLFRPADCWDSQDDFWGSKNQSALVICAAVSFFVLSFLKISGWKGFFKTAAVSYLCFQLFTLTSIYDSIYTQHCLFPDTITEKPARDLLGFIIVGLLESAAAGGIFIGLRSAAKRFAAFLFPVETDLLKLDLNIR